MAAFQQTTLFSELKMGDLTLKNRIALAPMTRCRSGEDGVPKVWNADYYQQRASAGLLITEGVIISEQGNGWAWAPKIYLPEHVAGWKKVTDAVHEKDGKIFVQLWHMGRVTHSSYHGLAPVGPSAIVANGEGVVGADFAKHPYEVPREMTKDDIKQAIEEFKTAAACAKDAGFDGIEVHAANGYVIDIWLQSKTNQRNDEYGGSKENRYRFLKEILEAVTEVWPANRVAVRISPNGVYNDIGSADNHETFSYVVSELNKFGLGYLHLVDGLGFGFHGLCKQFTLYDARKCGYEGIVMGSTGYSKDTASGAIGTGVVDMIAIGRPYMSNPDLVERYQNDWPLAALPAYSHW